MTEGFLLGIASIAIALIGFSGVVIALGRRGEGKWTPSEMLQLRTLVEPGIVSLLGAFVPILLGLLFLNETTGTMGTTDTKALLKLWALLTLRHYWHYGHY